MKVLLITIIFAILSACTFKKKQCSNLALPAEVTHNILRELILIIPEEESGILEHVSFMSWDKKETTERVTTKLDSKKLVKLLPDYGIYLFFNDGYCGGGRGYIIVKKNGHWLIDQEIIMLCPRSYEKECSDTT